ncbi:hypothetical protein HanHA89_Chr14g0561071 [Helianthus annuus]|nr:hypothetical protein HanHA89_Chr14g0561071 [Helianthus annuus]
MYHLFSPIQSRTIRNFRPLSLNRFIPIIFTSQISSLQNCSDFIFYIAISRLQTKPDHPMAKGHPRLRTLVTRPANRIPKSDLSTIINRCKGISRSSRNDTLTIIKIHIANVIFPFCFCFLPPFDHLSQRQTMINTTTRYFSFTLHGFPFLHKWSQHVDCVPHIGPLTWLSGCTMACQLSYDGDGFEYFFVRVKREIHSSHYFLFVGSNARKPFYQVSFFFRSVIV